MQEALTPVLAAMSELTGAGPLARDEAAAADLAADLADSLSLDLRKQVPFLTMYHAIAARLASLYLMRHNRWKLVGSCEYPVDGGNVHRNYVPCKQEVDPLRVAMTIECMMQHVDLMSFACDVICNFTSFHVHADGKVASAAQHRRGSRRRHLGGRVGAFPGGGGGVRRVPSGQRCGSGAAQLPLRRRRRARHAAAADHSGRGRVRGLYSRRSELIESRCRSPESCSA